MNHLAIKCHFLQTHNISCFSTGHQVIPIWRTDVSTWRSSILCFYLCCGLEWNSLLEYSGKNTTVGLCALSRFDFARSSCFLARFPTAVYARSRAKRYPRQRVAYYCNASATTQFELLKLSGDVPNNPGPVKGSSYTRSLCAGCEKALKKNLNGVTGNAPA